MIATNTITGELLDALLMATPPELHPDHKPPQQEQPNSDPLEEIVKFEREMSQVQEKYKHAEKSMLRASEPRRCEGLPEKLMENDTVRSYVARHASEILEQFELVLNTVNMKEAMEQTEREELLSVSDSAAQAEATQDIDDAIPDPSVDVKNRVMDKAKDEMLKSMPK